MIKDNFIIKINTKNLIKNYYYFKKRKKNLNVACTIKANAYGMGFQKIFEILYKEGCRNFFVATYEEGIKIDFKKKNVNIFILNGIQNYDLNLFKKNKLIPIINTIEELKRIKNFNLKYGIHIDTGINRLGIDFRNIPKEVFIDKKINIVISHLSSSDESKNKYNEVQRERFLNLKSKFNNKKIIFSLSNTNGTVLSKDYLFDMIRPGIGLYGGNHKSQILKKYLKPILEVKAKVIQIKRINKGEFIGYNQTYKTKKNIVVAIVGVGYADGIPRSLSNKGAMYYKNEIFKIIGRVSMDSTTIDITNSKTLIKVGMHIDVINYRYDIEKFADQCKTISNEFLTSIGNRVKRIYV